MTLKLADSHIHLFANGYPGRYGCLFPRGGELRVYEALRKVHRIERALIVGYEGHAWAKGNNQYLARLVKAHPWMSPLAFCPTTKAPSLAQLQTRWRQGFFGISLYLDSPVEVRQVRKWNDAVWDELNRKRAILSINTPAILGRSLRPLFERLGETRILLSHLGLPGEMSDAKKNLRSVLDLAELPQVGVKFSAAYACNAYPHPGLREILRRLHDRFGVSRLYWGSDFSPALDDVSFTQTIASIRTQFGPSGNAIFSKNLLTAIRRVRR